MSKTLEEYRQEFERSTNRSMSLPIAGMIVWLGISVASILLPERSALLILLFGSGTIFPIGLMIAKLRREDLMSNQNPLAKLMGLCVLMVNLLWLVHIPLVMYAPQFVPLSVGIGLGLHWIVYGWIIRHPLGLIHAVGRSVLIVLVWFLFPEQRILMVSAVVVLMYLFTLYQMQTRQVV